MEIPGAAININRGNGPTDRARASDSIDPNHNLIARGCIESRTTLGMQPAVIRDVRRSGTPKGRGVSVTRGDVLIRTELSRQPHRANGKVPAKMPAKDCARKGFNAVGIDSVWPIKVGAKAIRAERRDGFREARRGTSLTPHIIVDPNTVVHVERTKRRRTGGRGCEVRGAG